MLIGLFLVGMGILFILKNVGVIPVIVWGILWPSVLIIVGLYLFLKVIHFYRFVNKMWEIADKVEEKIVHPLG